MFKKIICQELLVTFLVFQFLVLYGTADYSDSTKAPIEIWDKIWYVGEALNYALFASYFAARSKDVNLGVVWKLLALFLILRLIWEIWAVIYGWNVNMKIAMAIFFTIISCISFLIISLPYLKKIWQR